MAGQLGRSCRWLERFCYKRFALTPHAWLARLRDEEIQQLARTGMPAKAICRLVGFADAASFCHSLKRTAGCTLRELRELTRKECSHKDNKGGSPPIIRTRQTVMVPRSGLHQWHCGAEAERWSGEAKRNKPARVPGTWATNERK
jgi:AraC-like DNA-binding protein